MIRQPPAAVPAAMVNAHKIFTHIGIPPNVTPEKLGEIIEEALREQLTTLALLPALSVELLQEAFGTAAEDVLAQAIGCGFVTCGPLGPEVHPLIRDYLLTKKKAAVIRAGMGKGRVKAPTPDAPSRSACRRHAAGSRP